VATTARAPTSAGRPAGARPRPAAARPAPAATAGRGAALQGPPRVTLDAAGPAEPVGAKVAADEIDLSSGELVIPETVAAEVKDGKDLDLKVRLPGLAEGPLRVRRRGPSFHTVGAGQAILLRHPALKQFAASNPTVLVLTVKDSKVSGWVGLGTPGAPRGSQRSLLDAMAKGAELMNWAGLSKLTFPAIQNKFEDGVIAVSAENFRFTLGSFLTGGGSLALDNQRISFDGSAKVTIPGGSEGELRIKQDPTGALTGALNIMVQIGSVSGTVVATLSRGFVSIMGQVAYSGDRLSGKVTLVATDEATARDITLAKPSAGGDVPIELPGPDKPARPGKRAFCGWGQLTFRVTDWLAGAATVIVNSKGQATIIGEIAPPREFILFEQKEWIKKIFKLEIRAGYGIPVVGQVGLFASIGLDAVAKIGPGKLYNLKLSGAYSTDPRVPKNLAIEGTINISAFAGLRLRAEAGLVVTILGHDIKAGVGLNAIAGVRGYVEATPRIGMRELTPGGKREYFIQGHLEIAAQPVLGFSGDLFVAIETPWWSPLSDKRWTWPLFSIEYPLPGEFGIGADVDYVLGSRKWPTIEFGEVNFDGSKFLTDVMNDNTDSGRGGEEKKQGDWAEGLGGKGKGGAKNKGGAGKTPQGEEGIESIGEEESFSDGNESHKLWFETKGSDARLMLASSDPGPVEKKLKQWEAWAALLLAKDKDRAKTLFEQVREQLAGMNDDADRLAAMNEATRKAREVYEKNKNKKKKKKGKKGKSGARELSKKLKAEQRRLRDPLSKLAALVLTVPFKRIPLQPEMHDGGSELLAVVDEQTKAGLQIARAPGATKLVELTIGSAPLTLHSYSKSGLNRVRADIGKIEAEEKKIQAVPTKDRQVNANNLKGLEKPAQASARVVSGLGRAMRIRKLQRAAEFRPIRLGEQDLIKFVAEPAKIGKGLYRRQFLRNMRDQVRDQQRGLRELSADEWFALRAKFSMDAKAFRALDLAGRTEVLRELEERAEAAKARAERYMKLLQKWIGDLQKKAKKNQADIDQLTEWVRRLDRAEQRQENAIEAVIEIARAAKGIVDVPSREVLKARFEGTVDEMRQRILGRQDGEKTERGRHKGNLDGFLKYQKDWSELAKTGSDLAILHRPDQVAGGYDRFDPLPIPPGNADYTDPRWKQYYADLRKLFGPKVVNELIGTQWKGQIEKVVAPLRQAIGVAIAYPIHRMNLALRVVPKEE
jgi:hypothetical protein